MWLQQVAERIDYMKKRKDEIDKKLKLTLPDEYIEYVFHNTNSMPLGINLKEIRKKDISTLLKVSLSDDLFPLEMTHPDDIQIKERVRNLEHYRELAQKKYYPFTTPEVGVASSCEACLKAFELLNHANPPILSINFTEYWKNLPSSILKPALLFDTDHDIEKRGKTLRDYVDNDYIEHEITEKYVVIKHTEPGFEDMPNCEHYLIQEMVQADFMNNGNECESLIFVYYRSAGTLHFSHPVLATKNKEWSIMTNL